MDQPHGNFYFRQAYILDRLLFEREFVTNCNNCDNPVGHHNWFIFQEDNKNNVVECSFDYSHYYCNSLKMLMPRDQLFDTFMAYSLSGRRINGIWELTYNGNDPREIWARPVMTEMLYRPLSASEIRDPDTRIEVWRPVNQ